MFFVLFFFSLSTDLIPLKVKISVFFPHLAAHSSGDFPRFGFLPLTSLSSLSPFPFFPEYGCSSTHAITFENVLRAIDCKDG